jgi:hypothetical protein
MTMEKWYELRVAGSPGTTTCDPTIREGVAISSTGRLCTLSSGQAMRFETEQLALDYLTTRTTPGRHRFEIVVCGGATAATAAAGK